MITLFCIRPKGFNVGNDVIFLGLKHFIRLAFGDLVNLISLPATSRYESSAKGGLTARTIYEMNQYGHGVIVGGGNLYENGELDVDLNALKALEIPLMLFSLSRGRIYNRDLKLVNRTDAMPDAVMRALNSKAAVSLARDAVTCAHLQSLGASQARTGGCPTIFLGDIYPELRSKGERRAGSVLISVRNPALMNIPPSKQASVYADIPRIVSFLAAQGYDDIKLLCHDQRDISFAITFKGLEYIYTDDVHQYLRLLRDCALNVSYRLHASIPCISMGTPTIQINYDERAISLMDTLELGSWGINLCLEENPVEGIKDRFRRLGELEQLERAARPRWQALHGAMQEAFSQFAGEVRSLAG